MRVVETEIPSVKVLVPVRHGDARGWFSETWRADAMAAAAIEGSFVQDNASYSEAAGTVRGLHFQVPPRTQGKLVRVVRGAIFDVAVDIRRGSPSFGRHVSVRLSADEGNQFWLPPGFAHGICTLEPRTEVHYKVTAYYSAEHDRGLLWNDPDLAIPWPFAPDLAHLSEKDRMHPRLRDLPAYFTQESSP